MNNIKFTLSLIIVLLLLKVGHAQDMIVHDWANLNAYRIENSKVDTSTPKEDRVVFIGNSITQQWKEQRPDFFLDNSFINRGISGQTTPQMLLRFREDVINLNPSVVVILAGTNDIAGNTGYSTTDMIVGNLKSMAELAHANGIKVIICSVLPAFDYPWNPGINPSPRIIELNGIMKEYAVENNFIYLDYFSSMVDERNGMISDLSMDGVHPNVIGFKIMEPLVKSAIVKVLSK